MIVFSLPSRGGRRGASGFGGEEQRELSGARQGIAGVSGGLAFVDIEFAPCDILNSQVFPIDSITSKRQFLTLQCAFSVKRGSRCCGVFEPRRRFELGSV